MKFLKLIKKPDFIIIFLLLIVALVLSAIFALKRTGEGDVYAEIIYGGNIVRTVDLNTDCTFTISELPNIVFEVKESKIAFIESDCPDKICVKTGFIDKPGQTAACLPNKTVLHINHIKKNTAANDIDTIIH